jgi:hypothetical protein
MSATIRQTVTIEEDGRVEIRSPQLHSGAVAEITVQIADSLNPEERLAALNELRRRLALTPESTRAWMDQVREERMNSTRPVKYQVE